MAVVRILGLHETEQRVGDLDFAAGPQVQRCQNTENLRLWNVAAQNYQVRRSFLHPGLFSHAGNPEGIAEVLADTNDTAILRKRSRGTPRLR